MCGGGGGTTQELLTNQQVLVIIPPVTKLKAGQGETGGAGIGISGGGGGGCWNLVSGFCPDDIVNRNVEVGWGVSSKTFRCASRSLRRVFRNACDGREGGVRGWRGPLSDIPSSMHWPRPMPTVDAEMQEEGRGWLHALARCNAHQVAPPPRTVTGDEELGRKSR